MKTIRLLLLFACLLPALRAADSAWSPLFARLRDNAPLFSTFEEERHYPFRVVPIKLSGELRFVPGRGLSLRYLSPEEFTLIVDDRGLLMRDPRGHERIAPPDHRAKATADALLQLMRFDSDALAKTFLIAGDPAADPWTLLLTPTDAELASSLGVITVTGRADRVETIVMAKSADRRTVINVTSAAPRTVFTDADLQRYFR